MRSIIDEFTNLIPELIGSGIVIAGLYGAIKALAHMGDIVFRIYMGG